MSLFEKIFNYQIVSRLDESGAFATTSQERVWLQSMLADSAAAEAFTSATLDKLRSMLADDEPLEADGSLKEKAGSSASSAYHPLLRVLRPILRSRSGICMNYRLRNGRMHERMSGFPYKLEYSMVKKEWSLLWYNRRHRALMSTKLSNIVTVSEEESSPEEAEKLTQRILGILESRKEQGIIEIIPVYNGEMSRILYAFSCFEKEVEYVQEVDTYRITLTFQADECEYVLSKIRFLGKRVRVVQGARLISRMKETIAKALARYEEEE
ncbi:WYL domain-containing protein [Paenibacillus kribbensis]|uniref:WYL domain-containing protein n=1 Tax=Paenibacillus kribbensis TaxID=172713 RepID=UPI002DBA5A34|nr:WYL domain-containing protein [Paenibacillus kribbensis]MEC0232859.1 WYL domain-containing protein [Paenibacillus kribbensis]